MGNTVRYLILMRKRQKRKPRKYSGAGKKTLFCVAVNLMELQTLKEIMVQADNEFRELPLKDRSSAIAQLLKDRSDVELKLRRKPG